MSDVQEALKQVIIFANKGHKADPTQEPGIQNQCHDAMFGATPDQVVALEAALELLYQTVQSQSYARERALLLDQQMQQLMDADALTSDFSGDLTGQMRRVEYLCDVADAARDRLLVFVTAFRQAREGYTPAQQKASTLCTAGQAYMASYRAWLVAYKQERAALETFRKAMMAS